MSLDHESLALALTRLKLTAIRDQLDSLLDEAAKRELTLREALAFLVEREVARKDERRIEMADKIAHFPMVRDLGGFDFAAQPSLDARQVRELALRCHTLPFRPRCDSGEMIPGFLFVRFGKKLTKIRKHEALVHNPPSNINSAIAAKYHQSSSSEKRARAKSSGNTTTKYCRGPWLRLTGTYVLWYTGTHETNAHRQTEAASRANPDGRPNGKTHPQSTESAC